MFKNQKSYLKMSRAFSIVTKNQSAALGLLVLIALPIAYTNCSAKMGFEASTEQRLESLNSSGTIVINNGDEFTNSENVTIDVLHASADKMYVTNDPTCETGGAWETISTAKPWVLNARNTDAQVFVKFSNDGALASDCLTDSIIHDDIAPTLDVVTAPPAFTNSSEVSAALSASDTGSGVDRASCTGSGSHTSKDCSPTALVVTSPAEGSHSYSVSVSDRAGNKSPARNVSFVVDRTVPTVGLNLTPSSITNQLSAEFRFSGNDALSGVDHFECRIGPAATFASQTFKTCVNGITTTLTSGNQMFEVRSVDRAGNMSSVANYTWTIDLGAPTVQITKTPGAYSNQTQASFEFVGTDDSGPLAGFMCKVDSAAAVACSSPYTSPAGLNQGAHTFSVTGRDIAGNISAPATYTWIVDTTLPTLTITSKPAAITNSKNADFVLAASDTSSGIDTIECQLDGGGFKTCPSTVSYSTLVDGTRKFEARAKDRAGNVSLIATHSWAIDTSKPKITIAGPDEYIKVRAATINLSVTDTNVAQGLPAATVQCKQNSDTYAACPLTISYTGLNEGKYSFAAKATDAAGNESDVATLVYTIDLTPPAINVSKQPLSIIYRGENSGISFDVTDSASGVKTVQCGLNGALATCTANYSRDFANLANGNHRFNIIATDNLGNESTKEIAWQVSNKTTAITQIVDVKRNLQLDVLVVIDNSGSMANEHKNMASRFGTFIDQLDGIDWQIGIVTTDVNNDATKKDGRLVEFISTAAVDKTPAVGSGQYIIKSSMDKAMVKAWFANTIQMETNGSGNEQGVAASYRAVVRSQTSSTPVEVNARNASLFRPSAALSILVVTDADETNPKGTEVQNKPETLINYIKSTWASKPFSFHSIVVPIDDADCKKKDGNESYGRTYLTLSTLTGGITGTVCADDYGSQLKDIGKNTQDLVSTVALDCNPLDLNTDGKPDITITTSNGTAAPAYTLEGMRLKFATPLPVGKTTLKYSCVAPL